MMRSWTLSELEAPLCGHLIGGNLEVDSVSTDSRALRGNALFVALRGENFDGHEFLQQAEESGAVAALVSREVDSSLPLLRVAETQQALGRLGAYNRQAFSGPLVAITGSSGKTTVKNMVHAVLSQRGHTLATKGNLNNEIGVPLTLLNLNGEHEFAVVEMGAGRPGDIAWLCELGQPSIALLLNALPAHLEGFGSVEEVAATKGEIFDDLDVNGVAVINADQTWAAQWRERAAPATVLDYGLSESASIRAENISSLGIEGSRFTLVTPAGNILVQLQLPGVHNVSNALAAVAVGLACELTLDEIRDGLESAAPVAGRLSAERIASGADVIDDCYNANPGSVRAAIDVLASCEGRSTLILGAMKELGAQSKQLHREIGTYAKMAGVDLLWGVGEELAATVEAFGDGGRFFLDREAAVSELPGRFSEGDTVLIKGSRSAGMELILAALQGAATEGAD